MGEELRVRELTVEGTRIALKEPHNPFYLSNRPYPEATIRLIAERVLAYTPHRRTLVRQIPAYAISDHLLAMPFVDRPCLPEVCEGLTPRGEFARLLLDGAGETGAFMEAAHHVANGLNLGAVGTDRNILFMGNPRGYFVFAPLLDAW